MSNEECVHFCDNLCEVEEGYINCTSDYCLYANIFNIIAFTLLAIPLLVRLAQFIIFIPNPRWTLKKIIFLNGVAVCLVRVIRSALHLARVETPLAIDRIIYWYGIGFIICMYSLLLLFWSNLSRHNKQQTFSWLGDNFKRAFIGWTLGVFLMFTAWSIGDQFLEHNSMWILGKNAFGLVIILSIVIYALVEGLKLYKILKRIPDEAKDLSLLKTITRLTIGVTAGWILLFVLLLFSTALRVLLGDNYDLCQSFQVFYRIGELLVISLLCFILRRYRQQSGDESNSSHYEKVRRSKLTVELPEITTGDSNEASETSNQISRET